jgi:hypothetical protein
MPDRFKTFPVECQGGLYVNASPLDLAQKVPGAGTILLNFEPDTRGGYRRINGYTKYSTTEVTGEGRVYGVGLEYGRVYAARKTVGAATYDIYYSTGTTWTSVLTGRTNIAANQRVRFVNYNITAPFLMVTDGTNHALKVASGSTTVINGTGAPADPKFAAEFRSRIVLAGYSSNPAAVILSEPNTDTGFRVSHGAIEFNVGDEIAAIRFHRDALYIFCRNSIKRLVGKTSSDFAVEEVTQRLGLYADDTVEEVNGDLLFLAPDGIRPVSQTERVDDVELGTISRSIQPIVRELIDIYASNEFVAVPIRAKNQYRLFASDPDIGDGATQGILGGLRNAQNGLTWEWFELTGIRPSCCAARIINSDELIVHGGYDGFVYRHDTGNNFNGGDIEWVYTTPFYDVGDPTIRKALYKLDVFFRTEGAVGGTIQTLFDYDSPTVVYPPPINFSIGGNNVAIYNNPFSLYDTAVYDEGQNNKPTYNLIGSGVSFAYQFAGADQNPPFTIQSHVTQYNDMGRR